MPRFGPLGHVDAHRRHRLHAALRQHAQPDPGYLHAADTGRHPPFDDQPISGMHIGDDAANRFRRQRPRQRHAMSYGQIVDLSGYPRSRRHGRENPAGR